MLPKSLYEPLPQAYMVGGAAVVYFFNTPLGIFSGVVLFCAGALVAIMRSDNRRNDNRTKRKSEAAMPFWIYELLPFAYMVFAAVSSKLKSSPTTLGLAFLLIMIAGFVLLMRRTNRHTAHALF